MSILVLKLPDVKRKTEVQLRGCPYCNGEAFQRWGRVRKPIKDTYCRNVCVYRYRCCRCGQTFRHYPAGTSGADQTERLRLFAVICWTLGLSYRSVSAILSGLKMAVCPMTVWRDSQAQEEGQTMSMEQAINYALRVFSQPPPNGHTPITVNI